MQFGCFVALEGIRKRSEGLVHISQVCRLPDNLPGKMKDAIKKAFMGTAKIQIRQYICEVLPEICIMTG